MLSGYTKSIALPITAGASGLASGALIQYSGIETRLLIATGDVQPDRKDFRIVYQGTTEIDRVMMTTGSFMFRLQASISANTTSNDYAINYCNTSETTQPMENKRVVFDDYFDGDDLGSWTVTGTVNTISIPKPDFIKHGMNPTLRRIPGTFDEACIREAELFWNEADSKFYVAYDGIGETTPQSADGIGIAWSTDLTNWSRNSSALNNTYGDMIIHKFTGVTGYVGTWGDHTTVVDRIGMPPYQLHTCTASNITGPWSEYTLIEPVGGEGEWNDTYTIDGHIFKRPGDGTNDYWLCYGADGTPVGNTAVFAKSTSGPLSGFGGDYIVTPNYTAMENPRFIADDTNGKYYLVGNIIGQFNMTAVTRSNIMYYSTTWDSYVDAYKIAIIEPGDPGTWDCKAIGVISPPVIKDGMIYFAYDGSDLSIQRPGHPSDIHKWRDAGFVESKWPIPWENGIAPASGSYAISPQVAAANEDFDIYLKGKDSYMGLVGSSTSFIAVPVIDNVDSGEGHYDVYVNGSLVTPTNYCYQFGHGQPCTWQFRRRSNTLSIYQSNMLMWSGSSSQALSIKVGDAGVVEEARVIKSPFQVQQVLALPNTLNATFAKQTPVLKYSYKFGVNTVNATARVLASSTKLAYRFAASRLNVTAAKQPITLIGGCLAYPNLVSVTAAHPVSAVKYGATHSPNPLPVTSAINDPSLYIHSVLFPATLHTTQTILTPALVEGGAGGLVGRYDVNKRPIVIKVWDGKNNQLVVADIKYWNGTTLVSA
jgi:hypothetical protein